MNVIQEKIEQFKCDYKKEYTLKGTTWTYYKLGKEKPPLLFLVGGLKRAEIAYEFLRILSSDFTIIAPNYPPVKTFREIIQGIQGILDHEGIDHASLLGQSYGGIMAQAFLFESPEFVDKIILSNSGPANFGFFHLLSLDLIALIVWLIPAPLLKRWYYHNIKKILTFRDQDQDDFREAVRTLIMKDLSKKDILYFFTTLSDFIWEERRSKITSRKKPVIVFISNDDFAQGIRHYKHYKILYQNLTRKNIGNLSHTAFLKNPPVFAELVRSSLMSL